MLLGVLSMHGLQCEPERRWLKGEVGTRRNAPQGCAHTKGPHKGPLWHYSPPMVFH